ncbi:MAG: adenylate/guanylate cyclase domain-containing protein [Oligoflexia bacterium]|nr:adenylate/guanylate cyclase domain-containing protein [Oligoflexia bacterium]
MGHKNINQKLIGKVSLAFLLSIVLIYSTLFTLFHKNLLPTGYSTAIFSVAENWISDLKSIIFVSEESKISNNQLNPNIVILAIGEETYEKFPYRSPLDRKFLADTINYLIKSQVKAIGIDILFDQPTEATKDLFLKNVLKNTTVPIVMITGQEENGLTKKQVDYLNNFFSDLNLNLNKDNLLLSKSLATIMKDHRDGTVREFLVERNGVDSFAQALAKKVTNNIISSTFKSKSNSISIIYKHNNSFSQYPIHAVAHLPIEWIRDKIILIGAILPHEDRHRTPLSLLSSNSSSNDISGIEIHAHVLAQILDNQYRKEIPLLVDILLTTIFVSFALIVGMILFNTWIKILISIFILLLLWISSFYFKALFFIPTFTLTVCYFISFSTGIILSAITLRKEKKFIRDAFSRYLSNDVINLIEKDPSKLKLGGERREITILFSDVAGFTTISESMEPEVLVKILNHYLDEMNKVIIKYGGTIDKYIGDAIVAFFGAPLSSTNHQEMALRCALEMDQIAKKFILEYKKYSFGTTRIGLNCGQAIVGNIGSTSHFDYTAIGDAVNVASRLEGANKYFSTTLCVSESVVKPLINNNNSNDMIFFRPIGDVILKGKNDPITVFAPIFVQDNDNDNDNKNENINVKYQQAIDCIKRSEVDKALLIFRELAKINPQDQLLNFQIERLLRNEITIVLTDK